MLCVKSSAASDNTANAKYFRPPRKSSRRNAHKINGIKTAMALSINGIPELMIHLPGRIAKIQSSPFFTNSLDLRTSIILENLK